MARLSDRDRILVLLWDAESQSLSNARVKNALNLGDDRYHTVRNELLEEEFIELTRGRGGGIRLTRQGERAVPGVEVPFESSVDREKDLYEPLCDYLGRQALEAETPTVVCDTSALRKRGKWQNPDVTEITINVYQYLRKSHVVVTTYEVKQFPKWNVSAVYEAASHLRFAHQSYVVLEWPKDLPFSLSDSHHGIDQLARACNRYGVGLLTLTPYYSSFRLYEHLEASARNPTDADVEEWLSYLFSRNSAAREEFNEAWAEADKSLNGSS